MDQGADLASSPGCASSGNLRHLFNLDVQIARYWARYGECLQMHAGRIPDTDSATRSDGGAMPWLQGSIYPRIKGGGFRYQEQTTDAAETI